MRSTSVTRLVKAPVTNSMASLHTNQSYANLQDGLLTTSVSPRLRKVTDPKARQMHEIKQELLL